MIDAAPLAPAPGAEERQWRLYSRAWDILEGRKNGQALPIFFALAVRGFAPAQDVVSDFVSPDERIAWLRKAVAGGHDLALYNLAIEFLNRGDRSAYRHWLSRAAKTNPDAKAELKQFRTRFSHEAVRKFGWIAPEADRRKRKI